MNLVQLVINQARERPDQTALIDGRCGHERLISFRQLEGRIHACAETLKVSGIGPDSRVLVLVPMQSELYITLAALWKLGAVALFLDPSAGRKHIASCCERTRPDALIGIPKARLLWWLHRSLRQIPRKLLWGRELNAAEETFPGSEPRVVEADHPAILTFTSGSTGRAKGAIRSHGLLLAQYEALRSGIDLVAGETELATMPIIALVNLAAGITTLIPDADLKRPGFVKPGPVEKQIQRFTPTRCVASPRFLQRFPRATGSLRKIYTGGAPVFPRGVDQMQAAFPDALITILYGSTEAEPISHIAWPEVTAVERSQMAEGAGLLVGFVVPEAEVLILPDQWGKPISPMSECDWRSRALPCDQAGEIVVAGDHVIPGYLDSIGDADNKVAVEGRIWHRTGDAGYFDASGRLWLMGRCAASFQRDSRIVYPFPIECAAVEQFKVPIAACCELRGEPTLILPKSYTDPIPPQFTVGGITIRCILRREIPLDKRHNAKVDYGRLKRT